MHASCTKGISFGASEHLLKSQEGAIMARGGLNELKAAEAVVFFAEERIPCVHLSTTYCRPNAEPSAQARFRASTVYYDVVVVVRRTARTIVDFS